MKNLFTILFLCLSFTTYANEEKHVFVGKNIINGEEQVAFLLEILDGSGACYLNDRGELCLKADHIASILKADLVQDAFGMNPSQAALEVVNGRDPDVKCRNCGYWYEAQSYAGRRCPICKTAN